MAVSGHRITDGSSKEGVFSVRRVPARWARNLWRPPEVPGGKPRQARREEFGDLLEGVVAAAALLLMVVIDLPVLLAILLAVATYIGIGLVRTRRGSEDETPVETGPLDRRDERADEDRRRFGGEWVVGPEVAARFGLTQRQSEIVPLLEKRLTNKEIGDRLSIDHRTVERHVADILNKLDLESRRDVAPFCIEHGLLVASVPLNGSE